MLIVALAGHDLSGLRTRVPDTGRQTHRSSAARSLTIPRQSHKPSCPVRFPAMSDTSADPHSELLLAVAQGDELAFAELYRQTSSRLYGTAYRIMTGTDLARDALQEAFVKIWTEASQFNHEKGRSIHWMLGIQRNICIDMLRRRSTRPLADIDFEDVDIPVPAQEGSSPDVERCVRLLGDM